jgi:hypothetical protein
MIPDHEADPQRAEDMRQLKWALQGLAMAGSGQPMLFADGDVPASDLASRFDQWATVVRRGYEAELSPAQSEALAVIDRKLATMSDDGAEFDADLWTDAALISSEHWAELRRLASSALDTFGWPFTASSF